PTRVGRGGRAPRVARHLVAEDAAPPPPRPPPLDLDPIRQAEEGERRSSSRIGERELDRLLEPALDGESLAVALLLRLVLADDELVEPGLEPEPREVEEGAVLGRDRRRADRPRLREEGAAQRSCGVAIGRQPGVSPQKLLEHAMEDLPELDRYDIELGRGLLVQTEHVGCEELEAAGGEPLESGGAPPHRRNVRFEKAELTREPPDIGVGERVLARPLGARGEEVPAPPRLDRGARI